MARATSARTVAPQPQTKTERVALELRPAGVWALTPDEASAPLERPVARSLRRAFEAGPAEALLALLEAGAGIEANPGLAFLREVAGDALAALCELPETTTDPARVASAIPAETAVTARIEGAPLFRGRERLAEHLPATYRALAAELARRLPEHRDLGALVEAMAPDWHPHGRVWLHLAENRADPERPFAFLATFTPPGKEGGRHTPLAEALELHRGDRATLEALLAPLERAAKRSEWFRELLDTREIFHPLAFDAEEGQAFLREAERLRGTGVMVRLPKKWRGRPRPRAGVSVRIGESGASMDLGALLSFDARLALPDGAPLTDEETAALLEGAPRLVLLRGEWVSVDPGALRQTLDAWTKAAEKTQTVGDGLRLLAELEAPPGASASWSRVEAGAFLEEALGKLRAPGALEPSLRLQAELRPYQKAGLAWLATVHALGLGACLADDMGLGKTVQLIALFLHLKDRGVEAPALVVAPTSLLGNWQSELARFAPDLRVLVLHRSATENLDAALDTLDGHDVVLTTYGTLPRLPRLAKRRYALVAVDEAQAIKNPGTRQAKAVRKLEADARLALTGTPIENRLGDLWALFGFLNPGLLGGKQAFGKLVARLDPPDGPGFGPLRRLVGPYLLRRVKTDRSIIDDLPDKTEVTTWCALSPRQAALYGEALGELKLRLQKKAGADRRGLVLSFLARFKQICNHPSQWLEDGDWSASASGKVRELQAIAARVREAQEKLLVFTQYRTMTKPLHDWLAEIFGEPGLVIHGQTPAKKRTELVERFQAPDGPPFFVLSLKAAGTGLNLTAARHVVHFDRWWNPAVENQATDRAYRIGQHANVLVHRFVCRGTLEEKIDEMLEAKRTLADEVLSVDGGQALTELSDDELLDVVRLDTSRALGEEEG